jgi:hypothetical protein
MLRNKPTFRVIRASITTMLIFVDVREKHSEERIR